MQLGWSEYCFAVASAVLPHGITEAMPMIILRFLGRRRRPATQLALSKARQQAAAPLPVLVARARRFRSSEILASSVRSVLSACSLTLRSLSSNTASFSRVKACVDANSGDVARAPSAHTTSHSSTHPGVARLARRSTARPNTSPASALRRASRVPMIVFWLV